MKDKRKRRKGRDRIKSQQKKQKPRQTNIQTDRQTVERTRGFAEERLTDGDTRHVRRKQEKETKCKQEVKRQKGINENKRNK